MASGISAIVHTRNSAATLDRALRSLGWVDELIVVDMESRDATPAIARRRGARVLPAPMAPRVDGIRDTYVALASHDWIIVLDSDEHLADEAHDRIPAILARHGREYDAFAIPRFNSIAGQLMRGSGWAPDHQIRLFRKGTVSWSDTTHRLPRVTTGPHRLRELEPLDGLYIHHRSYENLRDFIRGQVDYALADRYETQPRDFDFSNYVAQAYERLALRHATDQDGDLSHALALLLAWDAILRGLVHWDSLDPRPPLDIVAALPVATQRVPWWQITLRRWLWRHHSAYYAARRAIDRLVGWLPFLERFKPRA